MPGCSTGDRDLGDDAGTIVALVVAAEDQAIELEPILESMAGGSHADDWPTREAILFHEFQLIGRDFEPLREEKHHIGGGEGI